MECGDQGDPNGGSTAAGDGLRRRHYGKDDSDATILGDNYKLAPNPPNQAQPKHLHFMAVSMVPTVLQLVLCVGLSTMAHGGMATVDSVTQMNSLPSLALQGTRGNTMAYRSPSKKVDGLWQRWMVAMRATRLHPFCDCSEGEHIEPEYEGGRWVGEEAGDGRNRWKAVTATTTLRVVRHQDVVGLVSATVKDRRPHGLAAARKEKGRGV